MGAGGSKINYKKDCLKSKKEFKNVVIYDRELCKKEKAYISKRNKKCTKKALQALTSQTVLSGKKTPVVSMCVSDGGYRAIACMLGILMEFELKGILPTVNYLATSGYASILQAAWHTSELPFDKLKEYMMEKCCDQTIDGTQFKKPTKNEMKNYVRHLQRLQSAALPISITDIHGMVIAERYLNPKKTEAARIRLSDIPNFSLMKKAQAPFPILEIVQTEKYQKTSQYYNYIELTPYRCGMRSSLAYVDTRAFGLPIKGGRIRGTATYMAHSKRESRGKQQLSTLLGISTGHYNTMIDYGSLKLIELLLKQKKVQKLDRLKILMEHVLRMNRTLMKDKLDKRKYEAKAKEEEEIHDNIYENTPDQNEDEEEEEEEEEEGEEGDATPSSLVGLSTGIINNRVEKTHDVDAKSREKYMKRQKKKAAKLKEANGRVFVSYDQLKMNNFVSESTSVRNMANDGPKKVKTKALSSRKFLYINSTRKQGQIPFSSVLRPERRASILFICDFTGENNFSQLQKMIDFAKANNRPMPTIKINKKRVDKAVNIFEPKPTDNPLAPIVIYIHACVLPLYHTNFNPAHVMEDLPPSREEFDRCVQWSRTAVKEMMPKYIDVLSQLMKKGSLVAQGSLIDVHGAGTPGSPSNYAGSPKFGSPGSPTGQGGRWGEPARKSSTLANDKKSKKNQVAPS